MAFKVNVGLDMPFEFLLLFQDFFMFVAVYYLVTSLSKQIGVLVGIHQNQALNVPFHLYGFTLLSPKINPKIPGM